MHLNSTDFKTEYLSVKYCNLILPVRVLHRRNPTVVKHRCAQCCGSKNEHSVVTTVEVIVLR